MKWRGFKRRIRSGYAFLFFYAENRDNLSHAVTRMNTSIIFWSIITVLICGFAWFLLTSKPPLISPTQHIGSESPIQL